MPRLLAIILLGLVLCVSATSAFAVRPDEILADPKLEARARAISSELRCMVCQNESIDDSNADLAHDIRVLVRARLKAGDSDQQVIDYLVSRYGEFVLLRPRFSARNFLLWAMPVIVLAAGGIGFLAYARRGAGSGSAPQPEGPADLSADEKRRLTKILDKGD